MMLPSLEQIRDAQALIYRHMPPTAQYSWPLINEHLGAEVWIKHENHTPVGAFKLRGGLVYATWLKETQPGLAGVVAAITTLPVVAVPMATTVLSGIDSLLSSVQMPAGVPVAAMAIDKPGAINAAIFAAEILATSDAETAQRLITYKEELAKSVAEKSARVKLQYAGKTS